MKLPYSWIHKVFLWIPLLHKSYKNNNNNKQLGEKIQNNYLFTLLSYQICMILFIFFKNVQASPFQTIKVNAYFYNQAEKVTKAP